MTKVMCNPKMDFLSKDPKYIITTFTFMDRYLIMSIIILILDTHPNARTYDKIA